jgi:hypothetical protein
MKNKKILKACGYRQLDSFWLKPVGSALLVYSPENAKLEVLFKGASNQTLIWNSEGLPSEFTTADLSQSETNLLFSYSFASSSSDWSFTTTSEDLELIL